MSVEQALGPISLCVPAKVSHPLTPLITEQIPLPSLNFTQLLLPSFALCSVFISHFCLISGP
jgi:hypothetical protein